MTAAVSAMARMFFRCEALSGWALLAGLQAVVALILFHDFIFGSKYFAYADIGSDTYFQFVPALIHMASPANWGSWWSFNLGLGGAAPQPLDPFTLLGVAGGPDHVLDMRLWVYLAKILTGGAAFYGFVLAMGSRRDVAVISALAYSFCGFVTVDGQWDPHSTEFAAYAVILWAVARHSLRPNAWLIPLSIAFATYCGVFVFSLGVFVAYLLVAALVASERPLATAGTWLRSILPQCVMGLLLAAPAIVPTVFMLLDSPRVTGTQATFSNRLGELLSINDGSMILVELAGMFHKNILGVGSQHYGWMNYLEGPGFFVGILPLLLIPQLWRGTRSDRKLLVAGGIALALFLALPAVRYLAFGFGLDYFRVNNLWVSILLLTLFARALDSVAERGVNHWLLGGTAVAVALLLALLEAKLRAVLSLPHTLKIMAFAGAALLLLALFSAGLLRWRQFAMAALGFIAAEAAVINFPSFNGERDVVTRETPGYNDRTIPALAFLKARDAGFYRVEKTYDSVSDCDALAQDYMGVKSYWFQTTSSVAFFSGLNLIPPRSRVKNFTNWLPNFGSRFALYSLVGVRYILSGRALAWPGFTKIHETGKLAVYENELALPLGVVYEQQLLRDHFAQLPVQAKDAAIVGAAIVDRLHGDAPSLFDMRRLERQSPDWIETNYAAPARLLQHRGMAIDHFSHDRITGKIASDVSGILVFSIPYAKGWSVSIDGVEQPAFIANLGMLATDVASGEHRVELRYSRPGLLPGIVIGLLGILAIWAFGVVERRRRPATPTGQPS